MTTGDSLLQAAAMQEVRQAKYTQRKLVNRIALALSLLAMAFGLFWLFWILFETVRLGVGGLTLATLTQMTPPPNDEGGLANAMYGSFLMVMLATLWVHPSASWQVFSSLNSIPKDGWRR